MKTWPKNPVLYQINTRVWLTELSRKLGRPATLDDIPDAELDRLAEMGFDWIWFLSVWQTGPAGQQISRSNPEWRKEFQETLPDLCEEDIPGSGFAITGYTVHGNLGGDAALARLRKRLRKRGLRLLLDFVPNHTGLDHPWVEDHPEYYIPGTELDLARAPQNYTWVKRKRGDLLLAHGRDPYFPGWPDTLQLNYGNPATQEAMIGELRKIAGQCDGVRCDMAMLVLPDVFERTWGIPAAALLAEGHPARARAGSRTSASWPRSTGTWNGRSSSRGSITRTTNGCTTASATAMPARCASTSAPGWTTRTRWPAFWRTTTSRGRRPLSRRECTRPRRSSRSCPLVCGSSTRVNSRGGRNASRRISAAARANPPTRSCRQFYERLLAVLREPAVRDGQWQLLECTPAWEGNWTWDCFVAFAWQGPDGQSGLLVAVNYAAEPEPVLRPASVCGPCRQPVAAAGSIEFCRLRPGWQRSAIPRLVPGHVALAGRRVLL